MATITAPPMTLMELQMAAVHHMLRAHGKKEAIELFLLDRTLYRITIAEVPPEDIPAATRQWMEEET